MDTNRCSVAPLVMLPYGLGKTSSFVDDLLASLPQIFLGDEAVQSTFVLIIEKWKSALDRFLALEEVLVQMQTQSTIGNWHDLEGLLKIGDQLREREVALRSFQARSTTIVHELLRSAVAVEWARQRHGDVRRIMGLSSVPLFNEGRWW
jgi:hypothetical protein